MLCCCCYNSHIRVSRATLLSPSILPPRSKVSRQAGKRYAQVKCVYIRTQHSPACTTTAVCTHSGWSCGEGKGREAGIFFSPLLCFALLCFFIICKKGTKSQLSFKLSAAWEHPTSQKSSMSVWEPSPHLSLLFLRVCTCSCKVPLRQKALPKICALLGKVKPCQDKGSGDEEASVGLNRPFFPMRVLQKVTCESLHCFSKSRPGRAPVFWR